MEKKKKAVVAGHICIDITPAFPDMPVRNIDEVLLPGRLVHMRGVDIHTGGAVANTGLAMKLLGTDVSLMGKIGSDPLGKIVLGTLEQYGAAGDMMISKDASTSYSVVLALPGIDRIFLHDPGANSTFSIKDLNGEVIREADLFHFGYPTLMKNLYKDRGRELTDMLRWVKELGTAVSLDMAAIDPDSEAACEDWRAILENTLPWVDFFVPSAEELCFMLDRKTYDSWIRRAAGRDVTEILRPEDIRPFGEAVLDMGAGVALIKCGASGMYYRTASGDRLCKLCAQLALDVDRWAGREGFEASYRPDAVISGTGAGDTSIAAFLTSVLRGGTLKDALRMATATGACCVAAYDALSGLQPFEVLEERIRAGWEKTSSGKEVEWGNRTVS